MSSQLFVGPEPFVFRDEGRQLYVGYWYDRLARHLLGATLLSYPEWVMQKSLSRFDLYSETMLACVEFKASNNMDQMKLFSDQLDGQIQELGFPYDSGFMLIFSYRNCMERNGRTIRLLKRCGKKPEDVQDFLVRNTLSLYAVSIPLLSSLRQHYGVKEFTRDKERHRKVLAINRTQFDDMAQDIRVTLSELGLGREIGKWLPPRARSIRERIVRTTLDKRPMQFRLVALLPTALRARLFRQIHSNGWVSWT